MHSPSRIRRLFFYTFLGCIFFIGPIYKAHARWYTPVSTEPDRSKYEIAPRLNAMVPLDVPLKEGTLDRNVTLREFLLSSKRPLVLVFNYNRCPSMCSTMLNDLVKSLKELKNTGNHFEIGKDFQLVTLSIDPDEKPELTTKKRQVYVDSLSYSIGKNDWPFLRGTKENIDKIADAVGFRYVYNKTNGEYDHSVGLFIINTNEIVSQVLIGLPFKTRELNLALVEAGQGKIGSLLDQIQLYCSQYDQNLGRYGFSPLRLMKLGGILTIVGVGVLLIFLFRQDKRRKKVKNLRATSTNSESTVL